MSALVLLDRLDLLPMTVGRATYLREEDELCRRSLFDGIDAAQRDAAVAAAVGSARGNRAIGCIVGMAVGDAVGAPLEFLPARDDVTAPTPSFDLATLSYRGASNEFGLAPGQWTDDAAMGLCLADSILVQRRYDGSDFRARLWNWWFRGYNNAFRLDRSRAISVGLGRNVSDALFALKCDEVPTPRHEADTQDSGNGPLIRLAAVPITWHRDPAAAAAWGAESSRATHPGPVVREATAFLAWLLARAINVDDPSPRAEDFLDAAVDGYLRALSGREDVGATTLRSLLVGEQPDDGLERNWRWRAPSLDLDGTLQRRGEHYNGYPVMAEYFGSYCLDGLALALHAVYHTRSFGDAVATCANHLGDADSTSAIAGQLAGALYGYQSLDERLVAQLRRWDGGEIALRGALLFALGERIAGADP